MGREKELLEVLSIMDSKMDKVYGKIESFRDKMITAKILIPVFGIIITSIIGLAVFVSKMDTSIALNSESIHYIEEAINVIINSGQNYIDPNDIYYLKEKGEGYFLLFKGE